MTARQQYWMTDPATGDHALVPGADARDELALQGWAEAEEPTGNAMVTIWHDGITEPGRVPASTLRDLWSHRGWVAGPPPGSPHPADEVAAETPAPAAVDDTKPKKTAAGGRGKDEE